MSEKKILFLFLDGVGLGPDDPQVNPFARTAMPNLEKLLGGKRLVRDTAPLETERATLLSLDACLGVPGLPQSATGQATLLTGENVPARLGYHYGPKPNPAVTEIVQNGNLFSMLTKEARRVEFLNAYPPRYFESIQSGQRIYATIPLAAASAGVKLHTTADLHAGKALSADFTAQGWVDRLGLADTPVISLREAGRRLALLTCQADFSLFEYWISDYAGHGQNMQTACDILQTFDQMLEGLLEAWNDRAGLILITSDHGNLEDMSTRHHTFNPVPGLLVGASEYRQAFTHGLHDLVGVTPRILEFLA